LVTLCGEPDFSVLLWQHDMLKLLAKINLNIADPVSGSTF
jgi:hypothetical protein